MCITFLPKPPPISHMSEQFLSILWLKFRDAAEHYRLALDVAIRVALAQAYAATVAGQAPEIVSGFRDPMRQLELIRMWDAGQRTGLATRPAERSWHMVGRAVDVDTNAAGFDAFRQAAVSLGARWGGTFSRPDAPHFDFPAALQPPSVYNYAEPV